MTITNPDQLFTGITVTGNVIHVPGNLEVSEDRHVVIRLNLQNSLGSATGQIALTIQNTPAVTVDGRRQPNPEFPFLKVLDLDSPPVLTDPLRVHMDIVENRIYILDGYVVKLYSMTGVKTGTNVSLGEFDYTGFACTDRAFWTVEEKRVLDNTVDVLLAGSYPLYSYGEIKHYNSVGQVVEIFKTKLDSTFSRGASETAGSEALARYDLQFGQASPMGLTQEDIYLLSAGKGNDDSTLVDYSKTRELRMYRYYISAPQVRFLTDSPIEGVPDDPIYDMADFTTGLALLQAKRGDQWLIRIISNNFVYNDLLTFPLHDDNTRPLAIAWNGAAFVVYDAAGKFYFYGQELPSRPTDPTEVEVERGFQSALPETLVSDKQYSSRMIHLQRHYDIFRRVGSSFRVVVVNLPCIVQNRVETSLTDSGKLPTDYVNVLPKYILPEIENGWILVPHEPGISLHEQRNVLRGPIQFTIEEVELLINGTQTFVCSNTAS